MLGYRLKCRFDENSAHDDPKMIVSLWEPAAGEATLTWEVPFAKNALDKAMVAAQKWMLINVYQKPCLTVEEAKARELDTSEVDDIIRVNFPRVKHDEALTLMRFVEEAKKRGMAVRTKTVVEKV